MTNNQSFTEQLVELIIEENYRAINIYKDVNGYKTLGRFCSSLEEARGLIDEGYEVFKKSLV